MNQDSNHPERPTPLDSDRTHDSSMQKKDSPSEELSQQQGSSSTSKSLPHYPVGEEPTIVSKNILKPNVGDLPLLGPSELASSLVGKKLGHFDLLEIIGGGGMGTVFRAHDTQLDRVVAVKILSQSHSANEDTRARFVNEAQSAARLDHENIARVYFIGEDKDVHYIVYEYIEGSNIRDLVIQRGPLSVIDSIRFTLQIGEALAHATKRDVVHRDIKPSNILVTEEGQARLVDMGLARLHQVEHSGDDLTASGVTLGTFDYISPEQARDPRSADVRSDLYSLGCTLFFMLAGKPPFPEGTVLQKLLQHQGDDLPNLQELRPDIPTDLMNILNKLCVKSPKKRYQHPKELTRDLVLIAEQYGISTISHSKYLLPEPLTRKWSLRRHLPWLVPCVLLITTSFLVSIFNQTANNSSAANYFSSLTSKYENQPPLNEANSESKSTEKSSASEKNKNNLNSKTEKTDKTSAPKETDDDDKTNVPPSDEDSLKEPDLKDSSISAADRNLTDRKRRAVGGNDSAGKTNLSVAKKSSHGVSLAFPSTKNNQLSNATKDKNDTSDLAKSKKTIIVGDTVDADYQSLAEAVAQARDGDSIELQFNGRKIEKPFSIGTSAKKTWNINITAGEDYKPIIQFQPTAINPDQNAREMLNIIGGSLSISDVDFEMDLPKQIAEGWSLFSLRAAHGLYLTNCTLTVRNATSSQAARHPDVAFIRSGTSQVMGMMLAEDKMPDKLPQLIVQLRSCAARGEANFFVSNQVQPVRFSWDNGLLVTTGNMFVFDALAKKPKQDGYLFINLTHTTIVAMNGVFSSSNTRQLPYQRDTRFTSSYNIFVNTLDQSSSSSLINQSGIDTTDDFSKRFDYEGDTNFYEGYDTFWEIQSDADDSQMSFDFDAWKEHWKKKSEKNAYPYQNEVEWKKTLPGKKTIHQHTVDDYLIDRKGNKTIQVDKKREWDAGFNAKALHKFPSSPSSSKLEKSPTSEKTEIKDMKPETGVSMSDRSGTSKSDNSD